nr:DsbA family protein [Methylobrevis pamukkalensis]
MAATIEESYGIAAKLGLSGTPTYVIGDEVVFGAVGLDELRARIADMRSCGKATC